MGPIEILKRARDIGVSEGMLPDEARTVRFLNTFILVTYPLYISTFLASIFFVIFRGWQGIAIVMGSVHMIINTLILLMNHRGRYTLARNFALITWNLYWLLVYIRLGKGTQLDLFIIILAGLAAIVYPKKESLVMYFMIALTFVFFSAVTLYGPDYAGQMKFPEAIKLANAGTDLGLFFMVVFLTLATRYSTIGAEDRLLESQKKIASLTDKLKIYLPHQFVDSLAKGDLAAKSDYKRRRLTIFFSDVQGFTAWIDKLEPEDTRDILNQYLSEMSSIANKWGGTIDEFIGDAIMIFFGAPEFTNDKDHAIRCVKMALEMQAKMNELRDEWEDKGHLEPLHIRIGINTGYVTVGNFGSKDRLKYAILGSAVNLASRLETASKLDKITISHMTWSLIKKEIACEPKGEITLKGFSEPVKIYEVVGIQPSANSASSEMGLGEGGSDSH